MNTSSDLMLAVLQHRPTPASTEESLARMEDAAARAAANDVQLLVCPEASLTGYNIPLSSARSVAVERDGDTTDRIRNLCLRHGIALAYGYIERDGDQLFNAVNVISASGELVSHYRKTHLWGELDRALFSAGDDYAPVFELNGWKVGLLICYDIEFPESSRHLSLQGAELILAPTALMAPWTFVADVTTRARAAENQVYFAYANYCGPEGDLNYVGRSCIIGPDGEEMARAGDEPDLLTARLTRQAIMDIRQDLPYHMDRRPELYQSLT
ncbi:carbon-nitrogen hydrolase family protein [Granulosicoccus sp. 3-233]|uniref:carbon-nitrogen hydrolase family protein n=1 Tax=Granulosicoccus sp. 3-233 TaxID=3417969 RepID=UPI003D352B70